MYRIKKVVPILKLITSFSIINLCTQLKPANSNCQRNEEFVFELQHFLKFLLLLGWGDQRCRVNSTRDKVDNVASDN